MVVLKNLYHCLVLFPKKSLKKNKRQLFHKKSTCFYWLLKLKGKHKEIKIIKWDIVNAFKFFNKSSSF